MRRLLICLVAFAALAVSAFAQSVDEIRTLNTKMLDACYASKWDEALGYLAQLEKIQPENNGVAYNYTCVYSRMGNADKAVEWLDKSIQWGWGGSKGGIAVQGSQTAPLVWHAEMLEKDTDLDNLRKDPRFPKLLERAKALQKRVEDYGAAPAIYVPEKLQAATEISVLIVLHDAGGNKDASLAAWKPIADELGCALVAPAARFALREDASRGWGWIDDPNVFALANRTLEYQWPVLTSLDALRKQKKCTTKRIWIAGEGQGATLALVTALHNSGTIQGAAVLDADVIPALTGYKVPGAKANGLRLEARFDTKSWKARGAVEPPTKQVQVWELAGSIAELAEVKDAAARQAALADAVRTLAKSAPPAPPAAPPAAPK